MKTNTKPPYRLIADSIREKVLAGEYALDRKSTRLNSSHAT